jgi:subtilisin family serine protease
VPQHKPPDKSQSIPSSKLVGFDSPERIPNRYMVVYKDDTELLEPLSAFDATQYRVTPDILPNTPEQISALTLALANHYAFNVEGKLGHIFSTKNGLRGFSVYNVAEGDLKDLAQDPRIKFIEPVIRTHAISTMNIQNAGAPNCLGDDCAPWDLDRIDQLSGIDGKYHYVSTGAGVTIWIMDSGISVTHTDFQGRAGNSIIQTIEPPDNGACTGVPPGIINIDNCGFQSQNLLAALDPYGHGTAVASAAAGHVYGVAKAASLVGIQVLSSQGQGNSEITAAAIDYVITYKGSGPNVMNVSFTAYGGSATIDAAANRALVAGITVVAGAGDRYVDACNNSPGDVPGVITVGGTGFANPPADSSFWHDAPDSASAYGSCVDILAPAVNVWAADNGNLYHVVGDPCSVPSGSTTGVCTFTGTSLSAPLVSGIAALYLQAHPTANPSTVRSELVFSAVSNIAIPGLPTGTTNLFASVWVPGNSTGVDPPGGGYPPFGGGVGISPKLIVPTIVNFLLLPRK